MTSNGRTLRAENRTFTCGGRGRTSSTILLYRRLPIQIRGSAVAGTDKSTCASSRAPCGLTPCRSLLVRIESVRALAGIPAIIIEYFRMRRRGFAGPVSLTRTFGLRRAWTSDNHQRRAQPDCEY